jgi:hypothetical protein
VKTWADVRLPEALPQVPQAVRAHLWGLCERFVPPALKWLAANGRAHLPTADSNLVASLVAILQVSGQRGLMVTVLDGGPHCGKSRDEWQAGALVKPLWLAAALPSPPAVAAGQPAAGLAGHARGAGGGRLAAVLPRAGLGAGRAPGGGGARRLRRLPAPAAGRGGAAARWAAGCGAALQLSSVQISWVWWRPCWVLPACLLLQPSCDRFLPLCTSPAPCRRRHAVRLPAGVQGWPARAAALVRLCAHLHLQQGRAFLPDAGAHSGDGGCGAARVAGPACRLDAVHCGS